MFFPSRRVTDFEPTALLAERVQNISMYTVYIDMFCTRSAKSAVGSKAVTRQDPPTVLPTVPTVQVTDSR